MVRTTKNTTNAIATAATTAVADYDSPWKEALTLYLPECLALLAPWLYEQIDWSYAPIFLDKELQALASDSANGRRYADKLVRLRNKQGRSVWLLLHVEVQGGRATVRMLGIFATLMYKYHTRIHDHHIDDLTDSNDQEVALISLGVLTHSDGSTDHLVYQHADPFDSTRLQFQFPVVHLRNWLSRWVELEAAAETNPFAVIVMAQLIAQEVPSNDPDRPIKKSNILRLLYRYRYHRQDIYKILRLVDWMINLNDDQLPVFFQRVAAIDQEYKMSYVSSFERYYEKRGLEKGQAILLQGMLTRKFGTLPEATQQRLDNAKPGQLETWSLNFVDADTLDDVFLD